MPRLRRSFDAMTPVLVGATTLIALVAPILLAAQARATAETTGADYRFPRRSWNRNTKRPRSFW
jgi:hypothetical protein